MNQHLVSEVYLKEFGYKDKNSQWRVCVLEKSKFPIMAKINKRWIAHKSIGSILSKEDFFDFEAAGDQDFFRTVEAVSAEVESLLPELYHELKNNKTLTAKGESILAHFTSNLFVRTSYFDFFLKDLIEVGGFDRLLEECLHFNTQAEKTSFKKFIKHPKFSSEKNRTNIIRFLFWNYFLQRLGQFQYYIIEPAQGKGWITCDNPVVVLNHLNEYSVIAFETEIIFPLTSKKLILFKTEHSKSVSTIFKGAKFKKTTVASSEITDKINRIISDTAEDIVILPDLQDHFEF
jgi:Protein of unknown function (DUF4238)